jgi:pyrimidine operon attenuation protein/uracil phosphoribosyltransferase
VTAPRVLRDAAGVAQLIEKMAREIAAVDANEVPALVGIRSRGVPLAERLASQIRSLRGEAPELGMLDITLYRDDFSAAAERPAAEWPEVKESRIEFEVAGRTVILVDDVLFTGRTIRAALNALMDYGRPRAVRLAVLVDRGLRQLPIQADFAGTRIETTESDHVSVHLAEVDGRDEILLGDRR